MLESPSFSHLTLAFCLRITFLVLRNYIYSAFVLLRLLLLSGVLLAKTCCSRTSMSAFRISIDITIGFFRPYTEFSSSPFQLLVKSPHEIFLTIFIPHTFNHFLKLEMFYPNILCWTKVIVEHDQSKPLPDGSHKCCINNLTTQNCTKLCQVFFI